MFTLCLPIWWGMYRDSYGYTKWSECHLLIRPSVLNKLCKWVIQSCLSLEGRNHPRPQSCLNKYQLLQRRRCDNVRIQFSCKACRWKSCNTRQPPPKHKKAMVNIYGFYLQSDQDVLPDYGRVPRPCTDWASYLLWFAPFWCQGNREQGNWVSHGNWAKQGWPACISFGYVEHPFPMKSCDYKKMKTNKFSLFDCTNRKLTFLCRNAEYPELTPQMDCQKRNSIGPYWWWPSYDQIILNSQRQMSHHHR